jgi:hypothetical protein
MAGRAATSLGRSSRLSFQATPSIVARKQSRIRFRETQSGNRAMTWFG